MHPNICPRVDFERSGSRAKPRFDREKPKIPWFPTDADLFRLIFDITRASSSITHPSYENRASTSIYFTTLKKWPLEPSQKMHFIGLVFGVPVCWVNLLWGCSDCEKKWKNFSEGRALFVLRFYVIWTVVKLIHY
jgi:hypothetical protein